MGYWKYSISSVLVERDIEDEVVVGLFGNGYPVGNQGTRVPHIHLKNHLITDQDRKMFLLVGITIDCKKYNGSCENLLVDEDNMMDVRSKGSDSRSVMTGMTPKTLIFLLGKKVVHRGVLN
ncbi:PROF3 protein, partial [Sterrhoptilus dennistouni]|nr:PROF3 protein [Sterrhoptilus dennistouni]